MAIRLSDRGGISVAAASFGAAAVCYLDVLALLASPAHETVFHQAGPAAGLFISALGELLVLALLLFAILMLVRKTVRVRRSAWSLLLAFLPWIAFNNVLSLMEKSVPQWVNLLCLLACVIFAGVMAFDLTESRFEQFRFTGQAILLVLAVPGAIALSESMWVGVRAAREDHRSASMKWKDGTVEDAAARQKGGRVIWIVLDELAYRQALEKRQRGLDLPEFDRWKAQGTIFTNVVPAGLYTTTAVTSLMTGLQLTDVSPLPNGRAAQLNESETVQPFDEHDTVFADADKLGYRTGLAGWYLPYCRMLPTVVSKCTWSYETKLGMQYKAQTIEEGLTAPIYRLWRRIPKFFVVSMSLSEDEEIQGTTHIVDFKKLNDASDELLNARDFDFVLLHMPIPHPNGIYDRKRRVFAVWNSSYVDNLALADAYLTHVRNVLEKRGEWDNATVVVMGDHSWRTQILWQGTKPWSADDQVAMGSEGFDPRPAYMVKLPHQVVGTRIDSSYNATRTRALLGELMQRKIQDAGQLQHWVAEPTVADRRRQPQPNAY